jgi:hypothetical protein
VQLGSGGKEEGRFICERFSGALRIFATLGSRNQSAIGRLFGMRPGHLSPAEGHLFLVHTHIVEILGHLSGRIDHKAAADAKVFVGS